MTNLQKSFTIFLKIGEKGVISGELWAKNRLKTDLCHY